MQYDHATSAIQSEQPGVLADIPRRQFVKLLAGAPLPKMRFVSFGVSHFHSFLQFFTWIRLLIYFSFFTIVDALLGRDTAPRRAVRLRRAFEQNGGSFIKLGIHLSMRIDFIPWAYGNELSRMTDRMEPFPIENAIAAIERTTGRPLTASFAEFDPQPISSSSVACTYQAILLNHEKVFVKVRRPGVGEQFMADLEAFDWLLSLAEFLTIFRPGFTQTIRREFRTLLLEELDFVQEARRQDAFRRAASRSRQKFFSALPVHLELSGEEVVVNEFVHGLWMWELLAGVENNNQAILDQAREMNVDPARVAERLLWVNYWAREENLFFHADPNPDNIIVGPDSTLYFVNFATTATLSRTKQQAMRQNLAYAARRDPQNMARASLILMEPLPPVDIIELIQELETYNWQLLYAMEATPDSLPWQERTSVLQWVGIIQLARKHGMVLDIQVLRLLHSTLLFESTAVRLWHRIDFIREYQKFEQYKAEQARRRMTDAISNQLDGTGNEQTVIRLDRIAYTVESLLFRTIHMLAVPSVNFNTLMSKWSFAVYTFVRFFWQVLAVASITAFVVALGLYAGRQSIEVYGVLQEVASNPFFQIVILLLLFINGRTVLFRMDDKEV